MWARSFGLIAASCLAACSGTSPSPKSTTPIASARLELPTLPTLADLAALAVDIPLSEQSSRPSPGTIVDEWTLGSPLPDRYDATHQPLSAGAPAVIRVVFNQLGAHARSSRALACVAREHHRFVASKGSPPSMPLRSFMARRCGWPVPHPSVSRWHLDGDTQELPTALAKAIAQSNDITHFGLWYAQRDDGSHDMVLAADRARASLDPMDMVASSNVVELSGKIPAHDSLSGYVTQGKFGANYCQTMPAPAGHFRLLCPVDSRDPGAVIDVYMADAGRLLSSRVLSAWVSPDGALSPTYRRLELYDGPEPIAMDADIDAVFLDTINDLRKALTYGELELAADQSEEFRRYHPYLEAAAALGRVHTVDTISLGLFAGSRLPGRVLQGGLGIFDVDDPKDRRDLIEAALISPTMRYTLLDPARQLLASSVSGTAGTRRGMLLATWQPAPSGHLTQLEDALSRRIELVRKLSHLAETIHVGGHLHTSMARQAALLRKGSSTARSALKAALDDIAEVEQLPMRGLVIATQDIHSFEVPESLLEPRVLHLAVHVEIVPSPGSRWSRAILMFAYTYDADDI